jgi:membrane-bound lytic murein transglycosylase A
MCSIAPLPRAARSCALALALALAAGCAAPDPIPTVAPVAKPAKAAFDEPLAPGEMALEPVPDDAWPDLAVPIEERGHLLESIEQSLAYFAKPSSRNYYPYLDIEHARVQASLAAFRDLVERHLDPASFAAELKRRFCLYRSKGRARTGEVLFTSYCEPIYEASLAPDARFRHPLYRRPELLLSDAEGRTLGWARPGAPSPTRRQIDAEGALAGRGLELCWLADPLEAYLVHVQGSARLKLPDGSFFPVGYAGKTEHPYASLGKALIRDGKVPKEGMSLAAIKRHFAANPVETLPYLYENPSYVFFRKSEGGPFGSIGARVTARASIATDKSVFPRGALAFVDGTLGAAPFRRFVLDQDTGGAIRSAGRCDIFAGTGPEAEAVAGATMSVGRLYYLFLRKTEGAAVRPVGPARSRG